MTVLIIGSGSKLGGHLMNVYSDLKPIGLGLPDFDITDERVVYDRIMELKPNLVLNCAGISDLDYAEEHRAEAELVNGYAAGYVAKACQAAGAVLVHYSCAMVFDGQNSAGYVEDDTANPINAYGKSKLLGEMEVMQNTDKYYIIRTSWLFGSIAESKHPDFVAQILSLIKSNQTIATAEDEFGNPTYMLDLSQASRALVEETKEFGIYHIVNTGVASEYDWAQNISTNLKSTVTIQAAKGIALSRVAKRPHYNVINNTQFILLRPWTEALAEYLQQYIK